MSSSDSLTDHSEEEFHDQEVEEDDENDNDIDDEDDDEFDPSSSSSDDQSPSLKISRTSSARDIAKTQQANAARLGLEQFLYRRSSRERKAPDRLDVVALTNALGSDEEDDGRARKRSARGVGRPPKHNPPFPKKARHLNDEIPRELLSEALGLRSRSRTAVNYNYDENEYADDIKSALTRRRSTQAKPKYTFSDSDEEEEDYDAQYDDYDDDDAEEEDEDDQVYPTSTIEQEPVDTIEFVVDHRYQSKVDPNQEFNSSSSSSSSSSTLSTTTASSPNSTSFTTIVDSIEDIPEVEYLIKWKGRAHIHNSWHTADALVNTNGYKTRLRKYIEAVQQQEQWLREEANDDEREQYQIDLELQRDVTADWCIVEKIIDVRAVSDATIPLLHDDHEEEAEDPHGFDASEYFVKWKRLTYSSCTWERFNPAISGFKEKIDSFLQRRNTLKYKTKVAQLRWAKDRPPFVPLVTQPSELRGGQLRDYQLTGLNFLYRAWCHDRNAILADEMGLGKTIQSVSLLAYLHLVHKLSGPFLVVVPLSTINNWQDEFEKWAPQMDVIVYVGDANSRAIIRDNEFYTDGPKKNIKFDVLLSTYEIVMKDKAALKAIQWNHMMVDEAHRLKNHNSVLYQVLSEMHTRNCVLITGTPLQNTLDELWALLHFIMPREFPSLSRFLENYTNVGDHTNLAGAASSNLTPEEAASKKQAEISHLHEALRPYLIRRLKTEVEKSLPAKSERILRVGLAPLQKKYYKWIVTKNFDSLNKGAQSKTTLLNIMVELKKCCNHPFLFPNAEERTADNTDALSALVNASGKMMLLHKLLIRLRETGHRVLIFSQMVKMLDILGDYLKLSGFPHQRLDGTMGREPRRLAMERFNSPTSKDFCFLLSTRAGGLGINLATADTVILFDSDWNPQNDLQAESRAHRIGQKNAVNVYRFVTKSSVEEKVVESAKRKMVLDHLVIQSMDTSGKALTGESSHHSQALMKNSHQPGPEFDKKELALILKFGAEELFKEGADEAPSADMDLDLDEILKRAEAAPTTTTAGQELLNAFQVTSFANDDDPTFWSRIVPQKDLEREHHRKLEELDLGPRQARLKDIKYEEISSTATVVSAPKKKKPTVAKPKPSNPEVFNTKETRLLIRSLRKFGCSDARLADVLGDAGLSEKSPAHASSHIEALVKACRDAIDKPPPVKAADEPTAAAKREILSVEFNGVSIPVNPFLQRMSETAILEKKLAPYASQENGHERFKLGHLSVRPPPWPLEWTVKDDAMLLYGCYMYGVGSFEQIRTDPNLGLHDKINPKPGATANEANWISWVSLQRRFETLVKVLDAGTKSEATAPRRKPTAAANVTRKPSKSASPHVDGSPSDLSLTTSNSDEAAEAHASATRPPKKRARPVKKPLEPNLSEGQPSPVPARNRAKSTSSSSESSQAAAAPSPRSRKKLPVDSNGSAAHPLHEGGQPHHPNHSPAPKKPKSSATTSKKARAPAPRQQLKAAVPAITKLGQLAKKTQIDPATRVIKLKKYVSVIGHEISQGAAEGQDALWSYVSKSVGRDAELLKKIYAGLQKNPTNH